ncbi:hypothetical protein ACFL4E_02625 [Candidatus Omnitrophota bacterium]
MKKIISIILIVVLAVIIVLAVGKNTVARVSIEKGVELVTGLPLKMKSLNIGIINTLIGIDDLKLYNPPGYKDKVMLDMPEIYVNYDLGAILGGKIHLEEVRIDLKEFVVVKNAAGEVNLNSLKTVQDQKKTKEAAPAEPKKEGKAPEFQIDTLQLKIGKVVYKDYSGGKTTPTIKEFPINIDERFENINDPNKLVALILVKALMGTTVGRLTNIDLGGLKGQIGDTLATAQEVTGKATEAAVETTKKAAEAAKKTTDAAKDTAESVGGMLKNPFGGK